MDSNEQGPEDFSGNKESSQNAGDDNSSTGQRTAVESDETTRPFETSPLTAGLNGTSGRAIRPGAVAVGVGGVVVGDGALAADSTQRAKAGLIPTQVAMESDESTDPRYVSENAPQGRNAVTEGGPPLDLSQEALHSPEPAQSSEEHVNAAFASERIVAEAVEEPSTPMVQAELVSSPVQAFNVAIDEDVSGFLTKEIDRGDKSSEQNFGDCVRYGLLALVVVLIVLVILVVTIPAGRLGRRGGGNEYDKNEHSGTRFSPSPSPTFSYPCYTSTLDIIQAQQEDDETLVYVICPNTTIPIGLPRSPAENDFSFTEGDFPLWIIRPNVTVQCGLDGRRANNCVLDGGFIQVLWQQMVPTPDGNFFTFNRTIDGVTVRGFTFTGALADTNHFNGLSVQVSNPGKNVRFEDCLWTNMTAPAGVVSVSNNKFLQLNGIELDDMSMEVTFSDCVFEYITYDAPVIHVARQSLTLERCQFRHISLSALAFQDCDNEAKQLEDQDFLFSYPCSGLLYCSAVCSMIDVCVEDFAYQGPSPVFVAEFGDGNNAFERLYLDDADAVACEFGIGQWDSGGNSTIDCLEIFKEPACYSDSP